MDFIGGIVKRVRVNHGLEHATIAALLGDGVRTPLGGYSTANGFYIYGRVTTEQLRSAAESALGAMVQGARDLAVSPYCGTNLAIGALVAGTISALLSGRSNRKRRRVPALAAGIAVSVLVSRPLGAWVQRRFTTSAEMDGVSITGIRRLKGGSFTIHRVATRQAP